MKIAVVLPALNEAAVLHEMLQSLQFQTRPADRVVVVDGGSADSTVGIARSFEAEALSAPGCGRGGQIAAGLRVCTEDVILVAHADMCFPPGALEAVQSFLMRHPSCPGGCLGHRFDNPRLIFRAIEWLDRHRGMRGHSYGDQAQFFRREQLERGGGFPELPLMEDVVLARRLRQIGRPAYLNVPVTVSTRRYERLAWWRVMWINWRLRQLYGRVGDAACWQLYDRYHERLLIPVAGASSAEGHSVKRILPRRFVVGAGVTIGLVGLLALASSLEREDWEGGYPRGEFRVFVRDEDGRAIANDLLQWNDGPVPFPVDDQGRVIVSQPRSGFQFGGTRWKLFWFIPMGDQPPEYIWKISAPGFRPHRVGWSELTANPSKKEPMVIRRFNDQDIELPVYDLVVTLRR